MCNFYKLLIVTHNCVLCFNFQVAITKSWLEMAIAMMKPILLIVFMMEVTVVEGLSLAHHVSIS